MSITNLLMKNGKIINNLKIKSTTDFLKEYHRGSYTTMRTLEKKKYLFQYDLHYKRLSKL
jgi:hypothetical protein